MLRAVASRSLRPQGLASRFAASRLSQFTYEATSLRSLQQERQYRNSSAPFVRRDAGRRPRPGARNEVGFRTQYANSEEILEGTVEKKDSYFTRFEDLGRDGKVDPAIVNTLTQRMGLETMTPVQSQTITELLEGIDIIAQARTGTGKTIAFLVPIIQKILSNDPKLLQRPPRMQMRGPDVRALVISPTRELAEQIAAEASKVVQGTGVSVKAAVGGTQKRVGLRQIMTQGCHILVGTPGRLHDILSDPTSGIKLDNLNAFVLDEADRLLDDGFLPEIQRIESLLPPKENRQNMLFSATVPREVLGLSRSLLNSNSRFVQTIQRGEKQTHDKVPQKLVRLRGMENAFSTLLELMTAEMHREGADRPFKAIVFCNSNAETMLYAEVFATLDYPAPSGRSESFDKKCQVLEIHSRLNQAQRTQAANMFKNAKTAVLFSSDVSARGMDYPNVTHVIQVGLPRSRDFYIHRLGRTARGDKTGEGWLLVDGLDAREVPKTLKGLPLEVTESLQSARANLEEEDSLPSQVKDLLDATRGSALKAPIQLKSDAYKATFGFMGWVSNKQALVDEMNARAKVAWGMHTPPIIAPHFVNNLGLRNCQGLNIGETTRLNPRRMGSDDSSDRSFGRNSGPAGRYNSSGRSRDDFSDKSFGRNSGTAGRYNSSGRDRDELASPFGRRQERGGARSAGRDSWSRDFRSDRQRLSDLD